MRLSPVSFINSEEICFLSELFLHSEGEKPCIVRVHLINHLDKLNLGQKKIQNENSCDLDSVTFVVFCYGNVLGMRQRERATCHQMHLRNGGSTTRVNFHGLSNHAVCLDSCPIFL